MDTLPCSAGHTTCYVSLSSDNCICRDTARAAGDPLTGTLDASITAVILGA